MGRHNAIRRGADSPVRRIPLIMEPGGGRLRLDRRGITRRPALRSDRDLARVTARGVAGATAAQCLPFTRRQRLRPVPEPPQQ
jgi:hypothetical protein